MAQSAPFFTEFATHEATTTVNSLSHGLREVWADVKATGALMPGKGWTFSVGTVLVTAARPVQDQPTFSDVGVLLPPAPVFQDGFQITPGAGVVGKQIVILQARGRDPNNPLSTENTIQWQRYFYGNSNLEDGPIHRTATNARAVAVWPVLDEAGFIDQEETRVAICGECFDSQLPRSQFVTEVGGQLVFGGRSKVLGELAYVADYPQGLPSGYIAVYRGDGELLWTHQFFYEDVHIEPPAAEGACAITDLSIRVETVGEVKRDVVTYCGISSFGVRGVPAANVEFSALTPHRAFDLAATTTHVDGEVDNGLGQWDGIVGRLSNFHDLVPSAFGGTTTVQEFHAVVGGREQDGLWGLVELPGDRFTVVGSTAKVAGSTGPHDHPFTIPPVGIQGQLGWPTVDHCLATVLVFNARDTRNISAPNRLVLESAISLGRAGILSGSVRAATVARDIHAAYSAQPDPLAPAQNRLAIVGSTNDPLMMDAVGPGVAVPSVAFQGPTDGFLLVANDIPSPVPFPSTPSSFPLVLSGEFQGSPGQTGWCGVNSWSEFLDHITVLGWTEPEPGDQDLEVVSFLVDTTVSPAYILRELRRGTIPTPASEVPAAMGATVATTPPFPAVTNWLDSGLGSPAGGGIAMDERGRVQVVGSTDPGIAGSSSFPLEPAGDPLARAWLSGVDAVRAVVTMLPPRVGRTDRSGQQNHPLGPIPAAPAGLTGSTTPKAWLFPLGLRPVGEDPNDTCFLRRMLLDWDGPEPRQTTPPAKEGDPLEPEHFLIVDRPPESSQVLGTMVQFGVPTAPTPPNPLPVVFLEDWVPSGVVTHILIPSGQLSARIPLLLPPPGTGVTFSAQVFLLWDKCDGLAFAGTPAIVFSY